MNLKLDENLSRHLRKSLSALGHDVTTAADQGLLSQPDAAISAAARKSSRDHSVPAEKLRAAGS